MSIQLDPHVRVEWIVAPADDPDAEWQHAACCAALALRQPVDRPPPASEGDDEWWPGRCIP